MRTEILTALKPTNGGVERVNVGMRFIDGDGKSIIVEIRGGDVEVRSGDAGGIMIKPSASNAVVVVPD